MKKKILEILENRQMDYIMIVPQVLPEYPSIERYVVVSPITTDIKLNDIESARMELETAQVHVVDVAVTRYYIYMVLEVKENRGGKK